MLLEMRWQGSGCAADDWGTKSAGAWHTRVGDDLLQRVHMLDCTYPRCIYFSLAVARPGLLKLPVGARFSDVCSHLKQRVEDCGGTAGWPQV